MAGHPEEPLPPFGRYLLVGPPRPEGAPPPKKEHPLGRRADEALARAIRRGVDPVVWRIVGSPHWQVSPHEIEHQWGMDTIYRAHQWLDLQGRIADLQELADAQKRATERARANLLRCRR